MTFVGIDTRLDQTDKHIESIKAIAAEVRDGATFVDDNRQAQRAIFQLLDVHVILSHCGDVEKIVGPMYLAHLATRAVQWITL